MKKGKIILSLLVFIIAIGTAFAFKAQKPLPGDLYYINDNSDCVRAPCEVNNNTSNPCLLTLFSDNGCSNAYTDQAWTTNCGIK